NGYNLMEFPLIERKAVLGQLIPENDGWIRYADHIEGDGVTFFEAVSKRGLEGIVAKLKKSEYQQTRSRYWLKIKTQMTDRFVVGGFTAPEGTRKLFGALLLGLYSNSSLIYVGRTGGGFDDRMLAQAYDEVKPLVTETCPFKEVPAEVRKATWVQPQLVCEVRFNEWTSDQKLRAPIFQGFRNDLDPKDCRLEDALPSSPPKLGGGPSEARRGGSVAEVSRFGTTSARPLRLRPVGLALRGGTPPKLGEESHKIEFTNLDKVFWPEDRYTKGDLVDYYDKISPYIISHLLDRP